MLKIVFHNHKPFFIIITKLWVGLKPMTFSQIEVLRFLNECQIILEVNQAGLLILEWRDGIKAKVSLPLGLANLPRKMKNSVLKYSSFITNLFRFTRDKLFGLWDIELKGREIVCVCVWMCVCECLSCESYWRITYIPWLLLDTRFRSFIYLIDSS